MSVPGLTYVPDFVVEPRQAELLAAVDAESWRNDLKRRVQHYGWRYDYTARTVEPSMFLGPLPAWAAPLAARLAAEGHMPEAPDQLIVNESERGQGISPHVDCVPCFGPVVCSLTLGSACVMELSRIEGEEVEPLLLEPGSLLVLSSEARYGWRHGIRSRRRDTFAGRVIQRRRRVSLTYRTVIVGN